jgi:hypothetical protein
MDGTVTISILGFAHIMAYVECGGGLCFACITGIVASKAYGSYRCQHRSLPMPCIHRYYGFLDIEVEHLKVYPPIPHCIERNISKYYKSSTSIPVSYSSFWQADIIMVTVEFSAFMIWVY